MDNTPTVTAREKLILRLKALGLPSHGRPRPLVSLEEYFTENEDLGSIGCNLTEHPGLETFYRVLKDIRSRPSVQDVLVEVVEVEEQDLSMWPFSDRVYVFASTTAGEISTWSRKLQPDAIENDFPHQRPNGAPDLKAGMNVFSLWWD